MDWLVSKLAPHPLNSTPSSVGRPVVETTNAEQVPSREYYHRWNPVDGTGFPYGFCPFDSYGDGVGAMDNTATVYDPAQVPGSSSYEVSDGYDRGPEGADYIEQDVGGLIPDEQYPLDFGNFPTLGGTMVEGGTQGPLPLHPLPPHRELVPQVKYGGKANTKTRFTREPPITFAIGDQAGMTLQTGISLQDALDEKFVGLVDRDEGMFIGCRCTAISLRLQWPGCEPWTSHINTVDWKNPRGPITRSKLANKIARIVDSFIKANDGMTKVEKQWRVGNGHIELKDLVLDSIEHVSKGSWQPRVFVVRP